MRLKLMPQIMIINVPVFKEMKNNAISQFLTGARIIAPRGPEYIAETLHTNKQSTLIFDA